MNINKLVADQEIQEITANPDSFAPDVTWDLAEELSELGVDIVINHKTCVVWRDTTWDWTYIISDNWMVKDTVFWVWEIETFWYGRVWFEYETVNGESWTWIVWEGPL